MPLPAYGPIDSNFRCRLALFWPLFSLLISETCVFFDYVCCVCNGGSSPSADGARYEPGTGHVVTVVTLNRDVRLGLGFWALWCVWRVKVMSIGYGRLERTLDGYIVGMAGVESRLLCIFILFIIRRYSRSAWRRNASH
jgi:hypothetical protein